MQRHQSYSSSEQTGKRTEAAQLYTADPGRSGQVDCLTNERPVWARETCPAMAERIVWTEPSGPQIEQISVINITLNTINKSYVSRVNTTINSTKLIILLSKSSEYVQLL